MKSEDLDSEGDFKFQVAFSWGWFNLSFESKLSSLDLPINRRFLHHLKDREKGSEKTEQIGKKKILFVKKNTTKGAARERSKG